MSADGLPAVDTQSPWLGLASFTEETRAYFHGREEEVAELGRRVQRKLLTVLFGQSGLGKTSILRAGLVPRLRPAGYCPVYVRLDYAPESPPPAEQIKQAIFRATESSGQWTQAGTAVAGESLWEFLHHRDDLLKDASGKTLVPLLIFDQFEEIFTIAQTDDAVRKRAAEFLGELADLVENRPPKALEARFEADDSIIAKFDFARADYRILISLREDYLAHLEGVKASMPSITQNRMRIARMTGEQALAAVTKPGGRLVTQEVAEAIVRFVAGGAELRNAEVEPALLSLICRELNNARVAQGRSEITADLLAGSHDTILHEFYERALEDQPAAARRFIEDEMLTESGFRESLGEERVAKAFAAAGAKPDALATLVNRRLLRVEERLDVRRVELTHDVLCVVVQASRDLRHEREARDAAQRQLAEQKAREEATHRALLRARKIAAGCIVLAAVAAAGAIFGWINMNRARDAEAVAVKTRSLAEGARGEAEKLIVYLLDDFYLELEPVGRLDVVADLSKRAIAYYDGLPPELRTPATERNRALAQVRQAAALRNLARLDDAEKAITNATTVLSKLRDGGDTSEATAVGLALGSAVQGRISASRNRATDDRQFSEKAAAILAPLATATAASVAVRRAYGLVTSSAGFAQQRQGMNEEAVKTLEASRQAFRSIDDLKLGDLAAAAGYVESTAWQLDALQALNRIEEGRTNARDGIRVGSAVLEQRPGHMNALRARALLASSLAGIEGNDLRLAASIPLAQTAVRDWEAFVKLDPGNSIGWNNLGASRGGLTIALEASGRPDEAVRVLRAVPEIERQAKFANLPALLARNMASSAGYLARLEADLGENRRAQVALDNQVRLVKIAIRDAPPDSWPAMIVDGVWPIRTEADIAAVNGDFASLREAAKVIIARSEAAKPANDSQKRFGLEALALGHRRLAEASMSLRDYATAESSARKALDYRRQREDQGRFQRGETLEHAVLHAAALGRLGRHAEARKALEPALAFYGSLGLRAEEPYLNLWLATAKFAQALATPEDSRRLLAEAMGHMDRMPPAMARLKTMTRLRGEIVREQATR